MNEGLIPSRYAKALFEFAQEKNADTRLYGLMKNLVDSFGAAPQLRQTVANPFVADADKIRLLSTAAGADGSDPVFADFMRLLVENNRLPVVRDIALAYLRIYREKHHIYLVSVTSAAPMDEADENRLKSLIERHLNGAAMEYSHFVDPDLIGGFVVNINNEKLDASVANELEQLRLKLLSN